MSRESQINPFDMPSEVEIEDRTANAIAEWLIEVVDAPDHQFTGLYDFIKDLVPRIKKREWDNVSS